MDQPKKTNQVTVGYDVLVGMRGFDAVVDCLGALTQNNHDRLFCRFLPKRRLVQVPLHL